MGNGHLILDGSQSIMCCLFDLTIAQPGIDLLDNLPLFEFDLVFPGVSRDSRTGIIGNIEILRAAIAFARIERWMIGRTGIVIFLRNFFAGFEWTAELESVSIPFCPSADRFHLETRIA